MGKAQDLREQIDEARVEVFTDVMLRTDSPRKAMIAARPELESKPAYASVAANRMLKRTDVQARTQLKLERMAPKALKRAQELIMSDNESIATTNLWKVIEHVNGTPTHKSINLNASVSIEDALFDQDE